MAEIYSGYVPSNVSKDAKYSIKHSLEGDMQVHLVYRIDHRDYALLSTGLHQPLVDKVNAVKLEAQGVAGGVFYINEFRHVLVKTSDRSCYYAGIYDEDIVFDFEGKDLGPHPPPGLQPGDQWPGPHVGIRYTLTAAGDDIRYDHEIRPRYFRKRLLSEELNNEAAATRLAARLAAHKGSSGGRIYINEAQQFFAPVDDGDGLEYRYLGALGADRWFPPPS